MPVTPFRLSLSSLRALAALSVCGSLLAGCTDSVAPEYDSDDGDAGSAAPSVGAAASTSAAGAGLLGDASAPAMPLGSPAGPCDVSGRWLVALRTVTTALGTKQAAHTWYYYEVAQSGAQVTVSKGLVCGKDCRALSAVSGNADFPKAWPAMMTNLTDTGRKGTSSPAAGGCQVSFEKTTEVMSATVAYYSNFSNSLPTVSQKASGNTPGWEDWDQDGEPGYTMDITGLASGQIYMVDRTSYEMSGTIAASTSSFNLAVDWSNDQDVLGVNGPPILSETSAAVKDSDPSQHFATFARLTDAQATGDDASICAAIRSLVPTLAPDASN